MHLEVQTIGEGLVSIAYSKCWFNTKAILHLTGCSVELAANAADVVQISLDSLGTYINRMS